MQQQIKATIKHFFNLSKAGWFGGMKIKHRMNPDNPCGPHFELALKASKEGLTVKILIIKKKYQPKVPTDKWEMLEKLVETQADRQYPVINEKGRFYLATEFSTKLSESETEYRLKIIMMFWTSIMDDLGLLS